MAAEHESLVGVVLGGTYKVIGKVGAGGMGAVYRAEHLRLPRPFAIKVLHESVEPDSEYYHRFRREAEVCCRLRHRHIVEVVDFNVTDQGKPYIVMEYLEGEDLADRLASTGRFSPGQTASVLAQICAALSQAHAKGVVHRDLKPQNIFLCRESDHDDFVKLLDFGISKIQGSQSMLTGSGAMLGTPHYMSPEQAGADTGALDHRTDIYALGVIAYQMLSGRLPYVGENIAQIIYGIILGDHPPLSSVAPGISSALESVVHQSLAKKPNQRFSTIEKFSTALQQAVDRAEASPETTDFDYAPTDEHLAPPVAPEANAPPQTTPLVQGIYEGLGGIPKPTTPIASSTPGPRSAEVNAQPGSAAVVAIPPQMVPPQPITPFPLAPSLLQQAEGQSVGTPPGQPKAAQQTTMSAAAAEMGSPLVLPKQRKRWRPVAFGAGAAALVLVGGVIIFFAVGIGQNDKTSTQHTPTSTAAARGQAKDMQPAGAPSRRVIIRLKRLRAKARCKVDGLPTKGNPLVLPWSKKPVKLTCSAQGYSPFETTLVPDQDRSLDVQMSLLSQPTRRPMARKAPRPQRPRPMVLRGRVMRRMRKVIRARRARPRPPPMRPTMRPGSSGVIDDDRLFN